MRVRDDCKTLSTRETDNSESHPENPVEGGVLAALPRTRPQRVSPRRAAARQRTGKAEPEKTVKAEPEKTSKAEPEKTVKAKTVKAKPASAKAAPKAKTASRSRSKPAEAPAPKQGYEPEEEVELGKTVNPPSGVELVESVADIFGELANSSLAAGGRILKDAFSLLRRP
jgi:hypothetical protein